MTEKNKSQVTHLQCREIQAPLVAALIKGYSEKIGKDQAISIAEEIVTNDAIESGKNLAEKFSGNSFRELRRIVEEVWSAGGIMKIENLEESDTLLRFDVTHCGYAEMYERLGIREFGYLLSCCRDFAFLDGFNPEIELTRTKTVMQGDNVCDFCFIKK